MTVLAGPGKKMRMCAFLWSYYGYPNSNYEGVNVEIMRAKNGAIMAEADKNKGIHEDLDYVSGVPDSGTPHAIGYANACKVPFARPYIKYTPTWMRSFMPTNQADRNKIAKMKQIPVHELIENKRLLFVDDSIVRGTQLRETVEFLYQNGAKAVHMRSACPPIMYGCKYLNFSRATSDMDLIARRVVMELEGEEGMKYLNEYSDGKTERGKKLRETICKKFNFASLDFQSLEGLMEAIGVEPCKLCTYCWTGKE
jgi:amidophosphoribosyltransferase